jgi:heme/copper-type cytochrome/quinol oxidase subunit 3
MWVLWGKIGKWTGFYTSSSVFFCQYHSTTAFHVVHVIGVSFLRPFMINNCLKINLKMLRFIVCISKHFENCAATPFSVSKNIS